MPKHSQLQENIFAWHNSAAPGRNLVIEAGAGTGKTYTLVESMKRSKADEGVLVCFNKSIQLEASQKIPVQFTAKTYHALGFGPIRKVYGRVQVDEDRVERLLKSILADNQRFMIPAVKRLVSHCKNALVEPTKDVLLDAAFDHDIDLYPDNPQVQYDIFDLVALVLEKTASVTDGRIDFDDMIWLPIVNNLPMPKVQWLWVDELQDTNPAQLELVMRSYNPKGHIIGCGDSNQSIYRFRSADSLAMSKFVNRTKADTLPLSITYRCPKSVVRWVNQTFPEIDYSCPDTAIEGSVQSVDKAKVEYGPGDMALCRTNAPLVQECFAMLKMGRKAYIQGRKIGEGIVTLIKSQKADNVDTLLTKIDTWYSKEYDRLARQEKWGMITTLEDKRDIVYILSSGANTVQQVIESCKSLFADDGTGVRFSTVHKAKGLEAKNVLILHPELMPHPRAKRDEDKQQERNILYVAGTRALENLYFVQGQ